MFNHNANDGKSFRARVVYRIVLIKWDQFEDFISILVISAGTIFFECCFHVVRELTDPCCNYKITRHWMNSGINNDDVSLLEIWFHRTPNNLEGVTIIGQVHVNPNEIPAFDCCLPGSNLPC